MFAKVDEHTHTKLLTRHADCVGTVAASPRTTVGQGETSIGSGSRQQSISLQTDIENKLTRWPLLNRCKTDLVCSKSVAPFDLSARWHPTAIMYIMSVVLLLQKRIPSLHDRRNLIYTSASPRSHDHKNDTSSLTANRLEQIRTEYKGAASVRTKVRFDGRREFICLFSRLSETV